MSLVRIVLAALLAFTPGVVLAQPAVTRIAGTVVDDQGGVLPGVTVTATSPSLIGSQVAITESNGTYRFAVLPAGTYALTFELAGFQRVVREALGLELGQTRTVDATLAVAQVSETVTVIGGAPVVDRQSTTIGSVLDQAKLTSTPGSTDLWAALAQAPGVRMRGFDVGGSHKIQSTGYDAFGMRGQVRVLTEGVDQTEGTGGAGFYQDYYANSEVSIVAAGHDVTTNTPGALVLVTVKSGGNELAGLFHQAYEGRDFVGDNIDAAAAARGFTGQPNLSYRETHGDLGGPIVKDHLWFFAAANHFRIDKAQSGVPESVATDLGIVDDLTTKETWKPTAADTITGYYQRQHKQQPRRGLSVTRGPASTLAQSSYAWMFSGRWQRVWTNRLFTEVSAGQWGYDFPLEPTTDFRTAPPRTDLVTGVDSGAGFTQGGVAGPRTSNPRKPQVFATASYYLPTGGAGSHDLKAGVEWLDDGGSSGETGASGAILYLDRAGVPSQIRLTDVGDPATFGTGWLPSTDGNARAAAYVQDRWSVTDRLTVTAGVRFDRQRPYYEASRREPLLTDVFEAVETPGRTLLVRQSVAPRVGLSYDVSGRGRSIAKVFWGRYHHNLSRTLAGVNPGGTNTRTYVFLDPNGNGRYDGAGELGALVASTGGATTGYDEDLVLPRTDEVSVSFEQQLAGDSAVRLAWVRKSTAHEIGTYNEAWVDALTVPVERTVALEGYDTGITGRETFLVHDVPASLRGVVRNTIANLPASVDQGAATYDTFEAGYNLRLGGGLFVDASVDVTWKDDLRSADSTSNSPLTQADPIGQAYFPNARPGVSNRQRTSVWGLRASGRYLLPYAVGLGANIRVQSGWNYARVISFALPNAGTQRFWYEDLSRHRSDTVALLNARLDRTWHFGRYALTGLVDVFNVTNGNAITNFNLVNGPRYNQVNGALDPRTLQLGVRFEF
ncbi:MAG: carboxypeptidase regulatory-like domain-containing protein [Vicinamibacterales bacterium]